MTARQPKSARFRLQRPVASRKSEAQPPAERAGERISEPVQLVDLRVARRIRERRLRIGMTQQMLAQLIGVAFQQAHKYERGLSRISAGRLFHIATALRAPLAYFFLRDEAAALALFRLRDEGANDDG